VTSPSVTVLEDYEALSLAGADFVEELISANPTANVIVATGETPMGLYRELARKRAQRRFDAHGIRVFQLDEYVGIGPQDARSLYGWMVGSFVEPLGIPVENVVRLPVDGDIVSACAAFDRALESAGGLDLAILGIGENGHIGFNEPPSDATASTREVALSPETVGSNARYWGGHEQVPRRAMTVGLAQILGARRTLLVASGRHKREIAHRALLGPVTPEVPASYLQVADDVTVLVDREAWKGWDEA
jgi:glucosamine-6-phosphate deaminase